MKGEPKAETETETETETEMVCCLAALERLPKAGDCGEIAAIRSPRTVCCPSHSLQVRDYRDGKL